MFRSVAVELSARAGPFVGAMTAAGASMKQFGDTINAQSAKVQAATQRMGLALASIGVATVAAVTASATAAAQFEARMQNVATIWTDTSVSIGQAGNAILDLSTRLPQSANVLAEALYQAASSGFQGADALKVVEAAGTAASAGLTNAETATKGITAVLNAYGKTAADASTVSDVLFETVNLGVVTFEELSNSLGNFIGTTATAQVSIEDAAAAYATMTLAGLNADEAATSLNRTLQAFIQPGAEMSAVLKQMGYESGIAALQTEGLQGISEHLAQVVGRDNVAAFALLFPEMRGLRGELALLAAGGENYQRVTEGMAESAGSTQKALEKQSESAAYQLGILRNEVGKFAITFGQALLPVLKVGIAVLQTIAELFLAMPGWLRTVIAAATVLAGIAAGLAGAFILFAPAIAAVGAALPIVTAGLSAAAGAATAFLVALGPLGLAIGAIGAIGAVLWARHAKNTADAKRKTDELSASQKANAAASRTQAAATESAALSADKLAAAQKSIAQSLNSIFSIQSVTRAAEKDYTDTIRDELRTRQDAERTALTDTQRDEKESLDRRNAETKRALERRQRDELDALAVTHKAELDALDLRERAELDAYDLMTRNRKEALDRQFRDEKEALDRQFRAEKDALDERLGLLDDEYDARKKAEDRRYDAEKDRIQALIDDTFGQEREGHKAELVALSDDHDQRLNELDHAHEAEARAQKTALDDQQQQVKDDLDDRQQVIKDSLDDELAAIKRGISDAYDAEKQGYDDRYQLAVTAMKDRQDAEKVALDNQASDLDAELTRQQEIVTNKLEARQRADESAADARRRTQSEKATLTLAEMQTQLDEQLRTQSAAVDGIITIWKRAGAGVTAETMAEISKLPPNIIAELAKAGPEAFNRFIETMKQGAAGVDLIAISKAAQPAGAALADGMIQGWYQKFATTPVVGGLLQGVRIPGYAEGHYAEIAAGGPRLWAEPETGGEAYIPLASSKRARSVQILGRTAAHFGFGLTRMADGGIIGPMTTGRPGVTIAVSVENHLAPGIDMGVAGALIGAAVEDGVGRAMGDYEARIAAKAWR